MKHKVLAYILRQRNTPRQLLVFEHQGTPEAGVQVPAGTVEPGETPLAGVYREVLEEAGLPPEQLRLIGKLTETVEPQWEQVRHIYAFEALGQLPDKWAHTVAGAGEDEGFVFEYYWVAVTPELVLAGGQARWLPLIEPGPVIRPEH